MYCDTPQVNQLTALLFASGIRHVVCCPGSRNATIVHNLHEAGKSVVSCHPVTDERSAAFVALGITLATGRPSAVCVTSGSALLACIPAVAEAFYRHLPLLVISADRPPRQIGRMDGQTLPQDGALLPYCRTRQTVVPASEEDRRFNNTLINKALLDLLDKKGPAHINIPIEEPMFSFTTPSLPSERLVSLIECDRIERLPNHLMEEIRQSRLPALLIGQMDQREYAKIIEELDESNRLLIIPELISSIKGSLRMNVFDTLDEKKAEDTPLIPDLVIQIGGNFVAKRFKQRLRLGNSTIIRVGVEEEWVDTFERTRTVIKASPSSFLPFLLKQLSPNNPNIIQAKSLYDQRIQYAMERSEAEIITERITGKGVFTILSTLLDQKEGRFSLHLGNSSAVRYASAVIPSGKYPVYCNRGTNGIEGSLSTATGYALVSSKDEQIITVLGDLSFFYDVNALWNVHLPARLRIILLNNGHGAIFDRLEGLNDSPARDQLIAAGGQHYTAKGICETFGLRYLTVHRQDELSTALHELLRAGDRAALLEVFSDD